MRPHRLPWLLLSLTTALLAPAACGGGDEASFGYQAGGFLAARDVPNPGVAELDPAAFDRVVAISDVHGQHDEAVKLLNGASILDLDGHWSGGRTLLVVVGDSIDKGPDSVGVIDLWRTLATEAPTAGGEVLHLLGNHEAEFLANPQNPKASVLRAELAAKNIPLSQFTDPGTPYGGFLRSEPVAARIGHWLFAHAGYYPPGMTWGDFKAKASAVMAAGAYGDPFLANPESILESHDWWTDPGRRNAVEATLSANGMWGLVQGHVPTAYGIIFRVGAIDGGRCIRIDTGMAPDAGSNPGQVLVFNHPAQMDVDGFPSTFAINPDGTVVPIVPQVASASAQLARVVMNPE